jgi:hypothetical protein
VLDGDRHEIGVRVDDRGRPGFECHVDACQADFSRAPSGRLRHRTQVHPPELDFGRAGERQKVGQQVVRPQDLVAGSRDGLGGAVEPCRPDLPERQVELQLGAVQGVSDLVRQPGTQVRDGDRALERPRLRQGLPIVGDVDPEGAQTAMFISVLPRREAPADPALVLAK